MAVTKGELQVTWSSATSVSVNANSTATSDAMGISGDSFALSISCKADNNGTPAATDKAEFYVLYTSGDPDGSGADEYDSLPGTWLMTLDTSVTDPVQLTVPISANTKSIKVYVKNTAPSGNAITMSATLYESKG